jgi:ribonuclease HII
MIGIDEVGRGCWAGPLLVVAARNNLELPVGVADSKLLTKKQRDSLFSPISKCCDLGEGWVSAEEIDDLGLTGAMRLGVERALHAISASNNEEILLDGNINYVADKFINVSTIIDGDTSIPIISAASIFAKVKRDNYMTKLSKIHKVWHFDKHVGYGTKLHSEILKQYKPIIGVHRFSYKPVKLALES